MADQKKILIVDDEKPLSKALQLKLTNSGFIADTAADGEEALSKIASGGYDLVLLDLVMPRLDGFGVLTKLKENGGMPKVIVTSNLSQQEDIEKVKSLGAIDYLVKSDTSLAEIVAHVQKTLS